MLRAKQEMGIPDGFWDYNAKYQAKVMRCTSNSFYGLLGRTAEEAATGQTPDITDLLDFGIWDWVYFKAEAGIGNISIGKWLGPANRVGASMSFWVVNEKGQTICRSTVARIPNLDLQKPHIKARLAEVEATIKKVCDLKTDPDGTRLNTHPTDWGLPNILHDDVQEADIEKAMMDTTIPEADQIEFTPDTATDPYIHVELAFPHSEYPEHRYGKVVKRLKNDAGDPVGVENDNPMLDTRKYVVKFPDEHEETLSANAIAECMFSQVDEEGNRHVMLDDISDHRKTESAIPIDDAFITAANGRKTRRKTTVGWDLLYNWKDGSQQWISLKDAKNGNPVELAEYAVANRISEEPAFAWWVPHTLKKRNRIISKVKARHLIKTHKFGVELPRDADHAKKIDEANNNTLWWDAICEEMRNV